MDFFEEEKTDKSEKEIFVRNYVNSIKACRLVLGIVFSSLGLLFLICGVVFYFTLNDIIVLTFVFGGLGAVFILLAIIFFIVIKPGDPDKAYQRYKNRITLHGRFIGYNDLTIRMLSLEAKVKKLEEELESVKRNYR